MRHLGILLPETNTVVEHEIMQMICEDHHLMNEASFHFSRIEAKSDYAKDESAFLLELHENNDKARALLNTIPIDVLGFFCTSAMTVPKGDKTVKRTKADETPCCTPLEALIEACKKYTPRKVFLLSPYSENTARLVETELKKGGVPVHRNVCLGLNRDIDKYDLNDIREILIDSLQDGIDLFLLSCTNLKTLDFIARFESHVDVPVLSSNQSLMWAMCKRVSIDCSRLARFGSIFRM